MPGPAVVGFFVAGVITFFFSVFKNNVLKMEPPREFRETLDEINDAYLYYMYRQEQKEEKLHILASEIERGDLFNWKRIINHIISPMDIIRMNYNRITLDFVNINIQKLNGTWNLFMSPKAVKQASETEPPFWFELTDTQKEFLILGFSDHIADYLKLELRDPAWESKLKKITLAKSNITQIVYDESKLLTGTPSWDALDLFMEMRLTNPNFKPAPMEEVSVFQSNMPILLYATLRYMHIKGIPWNNGRAALETITMISSLVYHRIWEARFYLEVGNKDAPHVQNLFFYLSGWDGYKVRMNKYISEYSNVIRHCTFLFYDDQLQSDIDLLKKMAYTRVINQQTHSHFLNNDDVFPRYLYPNEIQHPRTYGPDVHIITTLKPRHMSDDEKKYYSNLCKGAIKSDYENYSKVLDTYYKDPINKPFNSSLVNEFILLILSLFLAVVWVLTGRGGL